MNRGRDITFQISRQWNGNTATRGRHTEYAVENTRERTFADITEKCMRIKDRDEN
jgi:hypothetical protein